MRAFIAGMVAGAIGPLVGSAIALQWPLDHGIAEARSRIVESDRALDYWWLLAAVRGQEIRPQDRIPPQNLPIPTQPLAPGPVPPPSVLPPGGQP